VSTEADQRASKAALTSRVACQPKPENGYQNLPTRGVFPVARNPEMKVNLWLFTQRQQGLMEEHATSLNTTNFQPLHPCLVGLPRFPSGRADCRQEATLTEAKRSDRLFCLQKLGIFKD